MFIFKLQSVTDFPLPIVQNTDPSLTIPHSKKSPKHSLVPLGLSLNWGILDRVKSRRCFKWKRLNKMATPSASFSLPTFSNISSVDHRHILVDKTGLSFSFVFVISIFFNVISLHLKSNSRNSLSKRKHFLAVFLSWRFHCQPAGGWSQC